MSGKEFYKQSGWGDEIELKDKYSERAAKFSYEDMVEFAEQYLNTYRVEFLERRAYIVLLTSRYNPCLVPG